MEDFRLSRGLDFYKPTMSQLAYEKFPDAQAVLTFKNRNLTPLSTYVTVAGLRQRFDEIREHNWQSEEIAYLASLQAQDGSTRFTPEYLDHLTDMRLPPIDIELDSATSDIAIHASGKWPDVSFWETVVMSELNEMYYRNKLAHEDIDPHTLYDEGDRRLSDKIARLQATPSIKIAEFGTRRRFSAAWQEHVIERLSKECPDNLIGTSNVWFAHQFNLTPIGTFAHELPMAYAALEDAAGRNPLGGHHALLHDWYERYGDDLSIALTDTFGSEFFFTDFSPEQALAWKGLRHDSGDPFEFGERVIGFYEQSGVNSIDKTLIFSDGLNIDLIERIYERFDGRINLVFGWGTTLTNDLGLPANNFVMKLTRINGIPSVKLSDNIGKHTGPEHKVLEYQQLVKRAIGQRSVDRLLSVS